MLIDFDKNILINGENVDGLKLLEGLVSYDFILIDPPYRTENKDFIYNDRLSRLQWITSIQERLEKAHGLLKADGAIAVHIDDKEYASLRMVMDEVFGEDNYINTFVIKRGIKSLNNQFEKVSRLNRAFEFLVVYQKSDQFYYKNPYKESSEQRKQGYWTSFKSIVDRPTMRYVLDGLTLDKGQWKWSKERGLRALHNYKEYENHKQPISIKEYWERYKEEYLHHTGNPLEFVRRHKNSAQYWVQPSEQIYMDTNMMEYIVNDYNGKKNYGFDTVKNLNTIKNIISIFTNKDSKVLDFYAGSGTTGHALMELNAEDGGTRTFTLITNDENKICSNIYYPRLKEQASKRKQSFGYIVLES
ncbi:site-specific DNA-methyltransferase (plasmid) [Aneurinibacillus sp. Ricciae_BoGa-3]|uniref:DNA methyltransferase n=1 Tax=Aneurinibacillus sp. Ricciae_BoGa-3 TaxID=3022697 RepID=UPI0023419AAC|nr:site-specific DNA-methyltransferase [Aneurinibacillus sp. Ricciae_BoGa-3]WCK57538.1 site-specific DNA-methyltransferase [Aneurinibacillus sp. Ricciae_BoGa-3]